MSADRRDEIAAALADVRARIRRACEIAGRADDVSLVVVTKTFPASDVLHLAELGVVDIAENRDQEARAKHDQVGEAGLRWHMIGHLQRNKAASVAQWADVVESVDRLALVDALARHVERARDPLDVLVQVSLDAADAAGRSGARGDEVTAVAQAVAQADGLRLRGVMAVAPLGGDADEAFARLAAVAGQVRARWPQADVVSAGMSGDLEEAIAHGATQVRVGSAILGRRALIQ